jgi:hypothetical protein
MLHSLKPGLIVLLIGFLIRTFGALLKIRHWPNGDEILTIGFLIMFIGIIILIINVTRIKK